MNPNLRETITLVAAVLTAAAMLVYVVVFAYRQDEDDDLPVARWARCRAPRCKAVGPHDRAIDGFICPTHLDLIARRLAEPEDAA